MSKSISTFSNYCFARISHFFHACHIPLLPHSLNLCNFAHPLALSRSQAKRRALTIQDTRRVNTGTWEKCGIAVPPRQLLLQKSRAGTSNNQAPTASKNDAISIFIRECVINSAYAVSHDTCTNSIVISALILSQIRPKMRIFRLPPQNVWELGSSALQNFGTNDRCHLWKSRIHFWPLKMGPTGCTGTSVTNYRYIQHIGYSRHSLAQYGPLNWRPFSYTLKIEECLARRNLEACQARKRKQSIGGVSQNSSLWNEGCSKSEGIFDLFRLFA
jgi:hypothetical protein